MARTTYREQHSAKGDEDDPYCEYCGGDWPCEPAILIRVVDATEGMDRPRQGDPEWMFVLASSIADARRVIDG